MRRRDRHARSFGDIVAAVEDANAGRLLSRARTANRLAKRSEGDPRRIAYAIKARTLVHLAERFPRRVCVAIDYESPGYVLVVSTPERIGLHAPARLFPAPNRIARAA